MSLEKYLDRSPRRVAKTRELETEPVLFTDTPTNPAKEISDRAFRSQAFAAAVQKAVEITPEEQQEQARRSIKKIGATAIEYGSQINSKKARQQFLDQEQMRLPAVEDASNRLTVDISWQDSEPSFVSVTNTHIDTGQQSTHYIVESIDGGVTIVDDRLNSWTIDDADYRDKVILVSNELGRYSDKLRQQENLSKPRKLPPVNDNLITKGYML